nr:hypothetical protein [uncultured Desulfobacter sp.]
METDIEKIVAQLQETVGPGLDILIQKLVKAAEEEKDRAEMYKNDALESKKIIKNLNNDKNEAEKRVAEAEEKAKTAEKLRDKEFASAISTLFEKPQKELENFTQFNIAKLANETEKQSHELRRETRAQFKQGFWLSLGILCFSIAISFAISSYFGKRSSAEMNSAFNEIFTKFESIDPLVDKTTTSIVNFEKTLENSFGDFENNIKNSFSTFIAHTDSAFTKAEKEFSKSSNFSINQG